MCRPKLSKVCALLYVLIKYRTGSFLTITVSACERELHLYVLLLDEKCVLSVIWFWLYKPIGLCSFRYPMYTVVKYIPHILMKPTDQIKLYPTRTHHEPLFGNFETSAMQTWEKRLLCRHGESVQGSTQNTVHVSHTTIV